MDSKETDQTQCREKAGAPVSLGRHQAQCSICKHPRREEIDEAWVAWGYTGQIAKDFDVSRDSIYRHAHATGLFAKRRANFKIICEKVLERVDRTPFNGSNVMSMFNLYVKLNLAEKETEAERPSDPKAPQTDETQHLNAPIPEGSLASLVEESVSAIPQQPSGATEEHRQAEASSIQ